MAMEKEKALPEGGAFVLWGSSGYFQSEHHRWCTMNSSKAGVCNDLATLAELGCSTLKADETDIKSASGAAVVVGGLNSLTAEMNGAGTVVDVATLRSLVDSLKECVRSNGVFSRALFHGCTIFERFEDTKKKPLCKLCVHFFSEVR